jgi:hypothetical protein
LERVARTPSGGLPPVPNPPPLRHVRLDVNGARRVRKNVNLEGSVKCLASIISRSRYARIPRESGGRPNSSSILESEEESSLRELVFFLMEVRALNTLIEIKLERCFAASGSRNDRGGLSNPFPPRVPYELELPGGRGDLYLLGPNFRLRLELLG